MPRACRLIVFPEPAFLNETIIDFQLIAKLDIIFSLIIYNGKDYDKAAFKGQANEID